MLMMPGHRVLLLGAKRNGDALSEERKQNSAMWLGSRAEEGWLALSVRRRQRIGRARLGHAVAGARVGDPLRLATAVSCGWRPDILYAVGLVSRYMEDPTTTHLKRILRYIKGMIDFGFLYSTSNHFKLEGYSDSDWGGDIDDRKSTTGFVFFMGDTTFTWMSKKQPIVTLSTCEAEYVVATSCCDLSVNVLGLNISIILLRLVDCFCYRLLFTNKLDGMQFLEKEMAKRNKD
ncbi:hypothetical protein ZIOFF_073955 [Zingiber officinale]|uniref:Mitochondrial protein n=1 Tax=Zingiber officinale TaxID=94328 RepID=A0A8J5CTR7_ZINOF|nr:hypothetical protein ZIOFF_073955 [Zingiber officinale]